MMPRERESADHLIDIDVLTIVRVARLEDRSATVGTVQQPFEQHPHGLRRSVRRDSESATAFLE